MFRPVFSVKGICGPLRPVA